MGVFSRPLAATRRALSPARFPPRRAQSQGVYGSGFIPTRKKDRACVWEREKMCECVCVCACVCICTGADFFLVWCVDYGVATPCRLPTFPGLFFERALQRYGLLCIRDLFCLINSTRMRLSSLATGWRRPTERFIRSFPAKEPYNYAALERDLKDKASYGSWPPSAYL